MKKIIIIGAGLSGIGAAYRFYGNRIQATVYEKNSFPGGNAASFSKDGLKFDCVPQISYTKDERIKNIFHKSADYKVERIQTRIANYWKGYRINHPIMANLFGLPQNMVATIIREFFEAHQKTDTQANNSKEILYSLFGKTFTDTFPEKFSEKYHTTSLANINYRNSKQNHYKPSLNEILLGAISNETKNNYHITNGYYPSFGGFIKFLYNIISYISIKYEHNVKHIDAKTKIVVFDNGRVERYDYLISSIPLPELIKCIKGVPYYIQLAADKLAYTSCIIVNIAVNRKNLSNTHQAYFYDHNIIFSKLTFPGMLSKNGPDNFGTIQAEIYFSKKYKPLYLSPDNFIEPTIFGLLRCGIIQKEDKILLKESKLISFANIIYDFERKTNLSAIHGYLKEIDIQYCGRFGDWENKMTDEAFISGEEAAQRVIGQIYSSTQEEKVSKKLSGYLSN